MADLTDVARPSVRTAAGKKFGPERRILKRADFQRVYSDGRKAGGRYVVVFCLRHSADGPDVGEAIDQGGADAAGPIPEQAEERIGGWRVGITATRKSGNAVQRNRQRRLVREFFRSHGESILGGTDYVVNTRRSVNGANFADVERDLLRTLDKLGRLAGHGPEAQSLGR